MGQTESYEVSLVRKLSSLSNETEWIEFKVNNEKPDKIGEYISALSNSAALNRKTHAYMIWGIKDDTHEIVGTKFDPKNTKKGNEELKSWLLRLLSPRIGFTFQKVIIDSKDVVLLKIETATDKPVQFMGEEYIRIGSYKKT